MTRARRIAVGLVAAAMLAAPSLAAAAQACVACCCPPAPCHADAGPCEAAIAPTPCGDAGSAAVPGGAERASDRPPFQPALPAASRSVPNESGALAHARVRAPELETSALRLSVVLRL